MTLPQQLRPMLAVAADPFDAPDYLFEVKWDGWRCLAFLDGKTRLQSRNLRDLTPAFPDLQAIHQAVDRPAMLLDGEIVTFWEGKPSFIRLQRRLGRISPNSDVIAKAPAVFIAFDLLYLEGVSLMTRPLDERHSLLERYLHPDETLQISATVAGQGVAFFEACRDMGLEGVVAKKCSSLYYPGKRTPYWKKIKAVQRTLFTICGYTLASQGKPQLNSLALAAKVEHDWFFFGLVGTGISAATAATLQELLQPLRVAAPPQFARPVKPPPRLVWVEPRLVALVEYLEITPDLKLRHPVWRGLQPDKQPDDF
ncbi:MAG: non-homologous end-joining DNA ligase [Bacillota bacterium]|jgi:DNA ligase D-like protein (predicted ligase)